MEEKDQKVPTTDADDQEPQLAEALEAKAKEAGKEKVVEVAPIEKEKTYTQAERDKLEADWNKRMGGLNKKLTEVSQSSKETVSKLEKALEEAEQRTLDARDASYLRKVEEDGGDVNIAKTALQRERDSRTKEATLAKKERELIAQEAILAEAGRGKKAVDLIKEHSLDADVVDELLGCRTPEEMEIKALKLRLEKGAVDAKPIVEIDSHDKGDKTDLSTLSNEEKLGMGMEGKL